MNIFRCMNEADRLSYEIKHRSILKNGCILSDRSNSTTYPRIRFYDKNITINQLNVAVILDCHVEDIPIDPTSKNQRISWRHMCGNKNCINPNHGMIGTQHDNCNDPDGTHLKSVTVDSIDGTHGYYFLSIKEASRVLDMAPSSISNSIIPKIIGDYCIEVD